MAPVGVLTMEPRRSLPWMKLFGAGLLGWFPVACTGT